METIVLLILVELRVLVTHHAHWIKNMQINVYAYQRHICMQL